MSNDEIVGEAGGIPGLVRIIGNKHGQPIRVEIDDLIFKEEDKQLISDVFVAALNDFMVKTGDRAIQELRDAIKRRRAATGTPTFAEMLGMGTTSLSPGPGDDNT